MTRDTRPDAVTFVVRLLGASIVCGAALAVAVAPTTAQNFPDKPIRIHRGGRGRRAVRPSGAAGGANPFAQARPAGGGREPRRRRRRHRRARGGKVQTRRLHAAGRQHQRDGGDPGSVEERRIRSREGFRADRQDHRRLPDPGGAPLVAVEDAEGFCRLRQSQSRQDQLRAHRRRRTAASCRRAVPAPQRHQAHRRVLPQRRRIRMPPS